MLKEKIIQALNAGPLNSGDVADAVDATRGAVNYHLKKMLSQGRVERSGGSSAGGMAYTYSITEPELPDMDGLREHMRDSDAIRNWVEGGDRIDEKGAKAPFSRRTMNEIALLMGYAWGDEYCDSRLLSQVANELRRIASDEAE